MDYVDDLVTLLPELILVALVLVDHHRRPLPAARQQVAADPAHRRRADPGRRRLRRGVGHQRDGLRRLLRRRRPVRLLQGRHDPDRHHLAPSSRRPTWSRAASRSASSTRSCVTALLGMCVLASSSDLITLFLGLELMTMPSYLLTGLHKTDRYSNEGGAEVLPARQLRQRHPAVRHQPGSTA